MDSDENESLQRLVHVQCNTSLRGTRKLRVAGWGLFPRPPPRHRKHYTGACAHACGHDIFCGSCSNRSTWPETHATLCAKWPGNCCECVSHISGVLRSSSSLLSISLVEPIPKHQKEMDKTPVLSLGPIHSLWHRHARDAHAHACTPTPARPQNTCTYPAVVSSPSRGSYASSSACFGFLVLPHPSISDGSNGPAGALNPKPHTLNLGPHTRIQTAAMALWVPATRQQRQNTLAKTATSPTQPVLRALTCARHACRSKAAMGIVETPQVLSY